MFTTWLFLIAKKQKGLNSKNCIVMCLVIVSAVPSFFGDTGQSDSRGAGLGEGRKGKGSLMRVEKSEGGRKRLVWTRTVRTSPTGKRKEAGVGWGEIGKWKQGYRQAQGAGHQQSVENQFGDRNISKASRVTQTQNQVQRQDSSSQPELHLSSCGTALLGLWERRLLAGLRGVG